MAQANSPEINLEELVRQVAREKDIEVEHWIAALEDAMASAAKKQHRIKEPVRSKINLETGEIEAFIVKQVVEEVEDPLAEWTLDEAREEKADAEVGEEILLPISTDGLGRIAAQSAKQVLYQRIREAERSKIYDEYIDREGEIVNGTVRRFERGDIIVDLGRTEAVVPRSEQARHERYSQGERIRAVIIEVHKQPKGPQVVLSRTNPLLLKRLFEMEVPEIYDGTVVIKQAVRAPGERAKVAVYSRERDVDPVGACVGMKGSRVQAIIRELRGEKIDIIEYSEDLVTFAQSALAPAKITRVSVKQHGAVPKLDVIVEDEQLSLAIGKRGQNVRLAAELIGSKIDIKSESDVKDEVAGALARMLEPMAGGDEEPGETLDLTQAPGVDEALALKLTEAGLGSLLALARATEQGIQEAGDVEIDVAHGILEWAVEECKTLGLSLETEVAPLEEGFELEPEPAAASMNDQDFMAALTKAFQETQQAQASPEDSENEDDETAEEPSDGDTEPEEKAAD